MDSFPAGSFQGKLLVANPALVDPNFERTVVLVLAHSDAGSFGVVLNRPSETDLDSKLPQWLDLAAAPQVVFVGGPVNRRAAICLARCAEAGSGADETEGWAPLSGDVGTLDLEMDPALAAVTVTQLRVFVGYAGWEGGQLENEIDVGAWWVLAAEPGDIFSGQPDQLWKRVLRRQGGELALVSSYPEDPSLN